LYFLIILQQFISAGASIVAKSVNYSLEPTVIMLYRSLLSALFFGGWIAFRWKKLPKIDKSDYWMLLILGIMNIPLNQLLFIWGLEYTVAPNASLAYSLTPAFVVILSFLFLKVRYSKQALLGIIIAFIGVFLILFEKGLAIDSSKFLGDIMVLSASFTWGIVSMMMAKFIQKYGAFYVTAISMVVGFITYLPIYALVGAPLEPQSLSLQTLGELFYLGIVTSVVSYALYSFALSRIETSKVAVFNNLQPMLTTLLAIIIFKELPSFQFVIGGVIAIVGVVITQNSK